MQTGSISFCDKTSLNVKSIDAKNFFNDKLKSYDIKILNKHFRKYDENSIQVIKKNPFLVSLKSNGNPYILFLSRFNKTDICLMIDKKIQQGYFLPRMIIDRLSFDKDLFEDTLFDGEMIKYGENKWTYMINDLIVLQGKRLENLNFLKRIKHTHDILEKKYFPLPNQKYSIQVKQYVIPNQVDSLMKLKNTLPYTSRGLLFKPMYLKFKDILYNFDDTLIENVKRVTYSENNKFIDSNHTNVLSRNEIDDEEMNKKNGVVNNCTYEHQTISDKRKTFEIQKTEQPDVYILYFENKQHGFACVSKLQTSKMLRKEFMDSNLNERRRFICEFNDKFHNKWVPIQKV